MTKYAFLATIGYSYVHPGVYILTEAQASAMKERGWLFWPGCAEMTEDTTAASLGPQLDAVCPGWTLSSSYCDWFADQRRGVPLESRGH
jgi:hypothetical protein